jgi:hypothetical protein
MFTNVFEFKPRSDRPSRASWNDLSAIERRFSRIAQELATRWRQGDIDAYLNGLLLDDRGNRQGFPADVLEELMFLSSLRWTLQHPSFTRADEGLLEQFSFSQTQPECPLCEPPRSWVLA